MNNEQNKTIYTKETMIRHIAKTYRVNIDTVRKIYNGLENTVEELLVNANLEQNIVIKLFEGITVNSSFIPEKTKVNNLTGKIITTSSKIKPRVNVTRNYCEKLTAIASERKRDN